MYLSPVSNSGRPATLDYRTGTQHRRIVDEASKRIRGQTTADSGTDHGLELSF